VLRRLLRRSRDGAAGEELLSAGEPVVERPPGPASQGGAAHRSPLPRGRPGHTPVLHAILASKILHGHLQNRNQLLDPPPSDLSSVDSEEAALLVRVMAAAAHADGELDANERARIVAALQTTGLGSGDRERLEQAITEPPPLESLIRSIGSPQSAARVYAVSLAVLDKAAAVNRAYLRYLAQRLALPADLTVRLNRRFGLTSEPP
jgi:uncharacterized membrane protein YebE (DUF533 family)